MNKTAPKKPIGRTLDEKQLKCATGCDVYLNHPRGSNNATTTSTTSESTGGGSGTDRSN